MNTYRTNAISDALDAGTYKLAFQLIAKALKRNPDDFYVQTLKIRALAETGKQDEAKDLAQHVVKIAPPTLESLDFISRELSRLHLGPLISSLYEKVAKDSPHDVDLQLQWTMAMLESRDYKAVQKAAMFLQSNQKTRREFSIRAAFTCYLLTLKGQNLTSQETTLYKTLGTRILDKNKPFQTAQEVWLYVKMVGTKAIDEGIITDYLQILADSLELEDLIFEVLTSSESHITQLYDTSMFLLSKRDDWKGWQAACKAAAKLPQGQVDTLISKIQSSPQTSRNISLAPLELLLCLKSTNFNYPNMDVKKGLQNYVTHHGTKRCAVDDISEFVKRGLISSTELLDWLASNPEPNPPYTGAREASRQVNIFTLDFLNRTRNQPDTSYISECARRYIGSLDLLREKSLTDYHPGDDYALIGMSSILSVPSGPCYQDLIRAAFWLEYVHQRDPHHFTVLLWLVRLYTLVGAHSLAVTRFERLSIKSLQLDTLGHHIFTRGATIGNASSAPLANIFESSNQLYLENQERTVMYLDKLLQDGTYSHIEDFISLRDRLEFSWTGYMINIEQRMAGRLSDKGKLANVKYVSSILDKVYDNRDNDTMYEWGRHHAVNENLICGPTQKEEWIRVMTARENLISCLSGGSQESIESAANLIDDRIASSQLTEPEIWSIRILKQYGTLLSSGSAITQKSLNQFLALLSVKFDVTGDDIQLGSWKVVHKANIILDTLKIIKSSVTGKAVIFKSLSKAHLESIKQTTITTTDLVQNQIKGLLSRNRKDGESKLTSIISDWELIQQDLSPLKDHIESFAGNIAYSQQETLTSITRIKV